MKNTKRNILMICCGAAVLLAGLGFMEPPQRAETSIANVTTAKTRIGIFDSRGVALAYGRSARPDCMMADVNRIKEQHEAAKQADNKDRMHELEQQAVATQEKIHGQVFSGAPIPEILALIKKDMPDIASQAKVSMIVGDVLFSGDDVELVDVTEQMCAPFQPDAKTLKMIHELIARPPVPESQLSPEH